MSKGATQAKELAQGAGSTAKNPTNSREQGGAMGTIEVEG